MNAPCFSDAITTLHTLKLDLACINTTADATSTATTLVHIKEFLGPSTLHARFKDNLWIPVDPGRYFSVTLFLFHHEFQLVYAVLRFLIE